MTLEVPEKHPQPGGPMDGKRNETGKKRLAEFVSALGQAGHIGNEPFPAELAKLIAKEMKVGTAENWNYIGFPPSQDPDILH